MSTPCLPSALQGLSAEIQVLLACARTDLGAEHRARIRRLVQDGVDWPFLTRLAREQRTFPLLYHGLMATCADAIASEPLAELRSLYESNALRNHHLSGQLIRALSALDARGVQAIPYRGPLLARQYYGDLALRRFSDLDVLVRPQDVAEARETLVSIGYRIGTQASVSEQALVHAHHYPLFLAGASPVLLELHWEIAEAYFGFSLNAQRVWDSLEAVEFWGARVMSLAPEDLLLVLCVHASKHGWSNLSLVCDVAEVVRHRPNLAWETTTLQARQVGVERMLLLGLHLASRLLELPLPQAVCKANADLAVQTLGDEVVQRLFSDRAAQPTASERARLFRFHLKLRDGPWRKLQHCLRILFLPTQDDWAFWRLPPALSLLYGFLRPVRLAVVYARRCLSTRPGS